MNSIFSILGTIFLIWVIYKNFFKPLKSYDDYIKRAVTYETFLFSRRKAINLLKNAFHKIDLTKVERASIFLEIGFYYFKSKDKRNAVNYFEQAFDLIGKERFLYNSNFKKIIKAYIDIGELEKAKLRLQQLLERGSYDPNFTRLQKMESLLNRET